MPTTDTDVQQLVINKLTKQQYDAITTKSPTELYMVTDELDYSTSEIDTGTTWIDGAHIYKKTINFGNLPNATAKYVPHGISNLNYVIKIEGTAAAPNSTWITLPVVYRSADAAYNVEVSVSTTDVVCNTSQDRSMFTAYVTLYYTKSA